MRDANVGTCGDVGGVNDEATGLDFAREEAGDAGGDAHGFVDAGFEVARL